MRRRDGPSTRARAESLTGEQLIDEHLGVRHGAKRFHFGPVVKCSRPAVDADLFPDISIRVYDAFDEDSMFAIGNVAFAYFAWSEGRTCERKIKTSWIVLGLRRMDSNAQQKILEDIERRWVDALLDERAVSLQRLING